MFDIHHILFWPERRVSLQWNNDRAGVQKQRGRVRRRIDRLGTRRHLPALVWVSLSYQLHLPTPDSGIYWLMVILSLWEPHFQLSSSGYYHFWRMCAVEIIDVSDDLMCLNNGKLLWKTVVVVTIIIRTVRCMQYPGLTEYLEDYPALSKYYAKSASPYLQQWWDKRCGLHWLLSLRFEDVGTLEVNGICPTQLHAKGRNKFRARGIFEHIPGQSSFFKGTDSVL